jgi:hypothetical protein
MKVTWQGNSSCSLLAQPTWPAILQTEHLTRCPLLKETTFGRCCDFILLVSLQIKLVIAYIDPYF